ncbi:fibronectin type 3 domain-containing protein [Natronobacillus azotifigens]|uniref:Beta-agarase/YXIM esterase-like galactose-binding domain-containing protein n=1 Tax=Natronobacillus azotifigens TaxID=472978 RepID=A0A9J6R9S7_9BACI|nr:hypothetical protein [Natronobacillus azotifigens]MCZ0702303.1 hypothetical protein [Natronobacillus azotifigens]
MKKKLSFVIVFLLVFSLFSSASASISTSAAEGNYDLPHLKFDLGTESSPSADGYTKISELTGYDREVGYGFDEVRPGDSRDQGNELRRDFVLASGNTFTVDLPNGEYFVEILTGSNWDSNSTTFSLQGADMEGGRNTSAGDFAIYEDSATVTDGQLTIMFGGVWARINAIEITEIGADEAIRLFDFGTETSPVEAGYTKVSNLVVYGSDLGYGFDEMIGARDQGTDLHLRDFVLASGNTFRVDVPNGDYKVLITTGAEWDNNRTSYSLQGGEIQGGTRTEAGQFLTYEDHIHVADEQITIAFSNEWARINAIEIVPILVINSLEVSNFSVTGTFVDLNWESSAAAVSYHVFRKEEGESNFTLIGETIDSNYRDETVNVGYTYTYAVEAVTNFSLTPVKSNEVTVTMIDENRTPPGQPTEIELGEGVSEELVTFSWGEVNDATLYYVYRSRFHFEQIPNAIESFERIGITDEPFFTDSDIHSPNPYYYFVTAVNEGGVSEISEVLEAQGRDLPEREQCGAGAFDIEVIQTNGTWQAIRANGEVVYSGEVMLEAVQSAVDNLTPDRTNQEKVLVRDSGTMSADESIDLPSHTILEVCGTIHVKKTDGGFSYDNHAAAVRVRYAENVSIPNLSVTGSPNFGIFVRTSEDIHLGNIDLRLDSGHGIRIDSRDDDSVYGVRNVQIDEVYVSGTSSHGLETYGVDGIKIGMVTAVDTGYSGVLLNDTINAEVDTVYGYRAASGTGYAAFRMANRNGHIDDDYTPNIFVGEVIARHGGRGIFSVSRSGGAVIDRIDIAHTGNNAILLENGYNITINGGIVEGQNGIRISARAEFPNNSDILVQNLTVRNSSIIERPIGENIQFLNITLEGNSTVEANYITYAEDIDEPGEDTNDPDEEADDPDQVTGDPVEGTDDPDEGTGDPGEGVDDEDEEADNTDGGAGDSDEEADDPEESTDDPDKDVNDSEEGADDEDQMPDTATNTYTNLLIGFVLLIIGVLIFFMIQKRLGMKKNI